MPACAQRQEIASQEVAVAPSDSRRQVHVHFTVTCESSQQVVDSSRGEYMSEVDGITVYKQKRYACSAAKMQVAQSSVLPYHRAARDMGTEQNTGAHPTTTWQQPRAIAFEPSSLDCAVAQGKS